MILSYRYNGTCMYTIDDHSVCISFTCSVPHVLIEGLPLPPLPGCGG